MRVLQIINSLATGGAEKLLLETIPLYNAEGVKTDLLVLNSTPFPFLEEIKYLNCCKIYALGFGSVYNPLNIFKLVPYLRKYDIVHVHLFPAQYYVVLAKLISFSKAKLIFTEHSTSNRRLESKVFRLIDKFIYQFYTAIVCITQEIKEILLDHTALGSERLYVIENGVNLSTIHNAIGTDKSEINKNLNDGDKLVIQVSGFRPQKDQETLIRAMAALPNYVKLLLVGDGVTKAKCETLTIALGLQERVFFLGLRMDVPQLLKAADVVVLSSIYEGLSLASIEGMASGKPFLASDVPGLKEVVQGAGILFPLGDEMQLAKEILNLLENPEYYETVVARCQKRANEYDIKKMVDQHIQLYKELYEV